MDESYPITSSYRRTLPIFEHRIAFLYALEHFKVVLILGETGIGKSTQIPQYLYESGWATYGRCIAVTQPRRLACTQLATRVSLEMSTPLGKTVGYSIRFDDNTNSSETRIKFLTDGSLLREMLTDPLLTKYSVIVIDEAHERSLNSDALFGLLRRILAIRRDLRLVIMSATHEAEHIYDFFSNGKDDTQSTSIPLEIHKHNPSQQTSSTSPSQQNTNQKRSSRWGDKVFSSSSNNTTTSSTTSITSISLSKQLSLQDCCVIVVEGHSFPVEIQFLTTPTSDYVAMSASTVTSIHKREGSGDILIFLPSAEDIDACIELVSEHLNISSSSSSSSSLPLDLYPLHSNISNARQLEAIESSRLLPDGSSIRKAIFATSIAETSLTLSGVSFVVDSGFTMFHMTEPSTSVSSLLLTPVSQVAAIQRAGRAGRVKRGKCFRLYTEYTFYNELPLSAPSEILRSPLAPLLLTLLALGITDIAGFEYLHPPRTLSITRALELLYALGAIEQIVPKSSTSTTTTTTTSTLSNDTMSISTPSTPSRGLCLTSLIGKSLVELPCDPCIGRMLLASLSTGCAEHMLTIAAMITITTTSQGVSFFLHSNKQSNLDICFRSFGVTQGDHLTLLNIYLAYEVSGRSHSWCVSKGINSTTLARVAECRSQLRRALSAIIERNQEKKQEVKTRREPINEEKSWTLTSSVILDSDSTGEAIRKCILQGYPLNVARLDHDGSYLVLRDGSRAKLHPTSIFVRVAIPPPFIVFSDAEWITDNNPGSSLLAGGYTSTTSSKGGLLLKQCSSVSFEWILSHTGTIYEVKGGFSSIVNKAKEEEIKTLIPPESKMKYRGIAERKSEKAKQVEELNKPKPVEELTQQSTKISEMIADSFQSLF